MKLHQRRFQRFLKRAFLVLRPIDELIEQRENLRGREIAELCEDVDVVAEVFDGELSARLAKGGSGKLPFWVEQLWRVRSFCVDDEPRTAARNPTSAK